MEQYESSLAAAYIRGAAKRLSLSLPEDLLTKPLENLTDAELAVLLETGRDAELKLYHFKKKELLPRVKAVLGILKGIQPESLLDVGSERGVFLFPFLLEFPWVEVTSVDLLPHRVEMLQCISAGGIDRLTAIEQNICTWDREDGAFDTVTLLEVLEHIPNVQEAVNTAVRLARRYVVVSVPSQPDDNPEHIHLLTKNILTGLFQNAGCRKLHFSGVNGHLILLANVSE